MIWRTRRSFSHIAKTIRAIQHKCPEIIIETLVPDFQGNQDSIVKVVKACPKVISHNIESVARLSPKVRDLRASYEQSLLSTSKNQGIRSHHIYKIVFNVRSR